MNKRVLFEGWFLRSAMPAAAPRRVGPDARRTVELTDSIATTADPLKGRKPRPDDGKAGQGRRTHDSSAALE